MKRQKYEILFNKLVAEFRQEVIENEEKIKKWRKENHGLKQQNLHLLKKLKGIYYDDPEINDSEQYLVDKIERLEEELRRKDALLKAGGNYETQR